MKLSPQHRWLSFESGSIDHDARTVTFSFSSQEPYERAFGIEILSHAHGAMIDDRFKRGAVPFLLNHDWERQIGTVLEYGVSGTRAFAKVKLSRSAEGADILADIEDGIRCNISVGYVVHEMQPLDEEGDQTTYLVTRWEPLEISLVSVPADATVGIGRSAERKSNVRSKQGSDSEAVFELAILRGVPGLDAAWLKAFPSGTPERFPKGDWCARSQAR